MSNTQLFDVFDSADLHLEHPESEIGTVVADHLAELFMKSASEAEVERVISRFKEKKGPPKKQLARLLLAIDGKFEDLILKELESARTKESETLGVIAGDFGSKKSVEKVFEKLKDSPKDAAAN